MAGFSPPTIPSSFTLQQARVGGFTCRGSLSLRVDRELELAGVGGCARRRLQGARIPTAGVIWTFS